MFTIWVFKKAWDKNQNKFYEDFNNTGKLKLYPELFRHDSSGGKLFPSALYNFYLCIMQCLRFLVWKRKELFPSPRTTLFSIILTLCLFKAFCWTQHCFLLQLLLCSYARSYCVHPLLLVRWVTTSKWTVYNIRMFFYRNLINVY